MWILSSFGGLSCGFEADGVNEGVDIVDDVLVEAVEPGSLVSRTVRAPTLGGLVLLKARLDDRFHESCQLS
jgi:hypothetical protein